MRGDVKLMCKLTAKQIRRFVRSIEAEVDYWQML